MKAWPACLGLPTGVSAGVVQRKGKGGKKQGPRPDEEGEREKKRRKGIETDCQAQSPSTEVLFYDSAKEEKEKEKPLDFFQGGGGGKRETTARRAHRPRKRGA